MLSDEYYEQDGKEQNDLMHYREFPHSLGSNSEQQLKPAAGNKNTARSSRVLNGSENFGDGDEDDNNNDDADYEEDEDEDDPDDADFESDYGITSERTLKKEELEEEDSDCIEKVLGHQPKGVAEEALSSKRSTDHVLLSYLFDSEPNWNEMEFLIKGKGQSHLHCRWKSFSELQNLSGFKKVLNYTKKVTDEVRFRKTVTREEIEVNDVSKEMDLDLIKQNSQVERIIADRISKDSSGDVIPEYLVKWQGLSYAEATWLIALENSTTHTL